MVALPFAQPVGRAEIITSDVTAAREFMNRAYGLELESPGRLATDWQLTDSLLSAGTLATGDLRLSGELSFRPAGTEHVVIATVLDGRAELIGPGLMGTWSAGDVFAANHPGLHGSCHTHDLRVRTLSLPRTLLIDVAELGSDAHPADHEAAMIPCAVGSLKSWDRMMAFLDALLSDAKAAGAPLLIGPAARLAAATVLATFPGIAGVRARDEPQLEHPDTVRRAVIYLETHADRDVTTIEVARALGVGPRMIQLAFRRHLGMTPTAFLRQVRLRHAHEELRRAAPGDGTTVARVALDWGFIGAGRFAGVYRQAFGELPRDTLRRAP